MLYKKIMVCALASLTCMSVIAHDVLLEVKGAAFVPTSQVFKEIYNSCGDFGIELTAGELCKHLYVFSSIDFLIKNGETVALESPTKVSIFNLALGLKYFVPFSYGDVYFGLGVQPSRLATHDATALPVDESQWTCGGIAKAGVIFDMPNSFFADIFVNYSFAKFNATVGSSVSGTTNVDGCLLGVGLGYRFN